RLAATDCKQVLGDADHAQRGMRDRHEHDVKLLIQGRAHLSNRSFAGVHLSASLSVYPLTHALYRSVRGMPSGSAADGARATRKTGRPAHSDCKSRITVVNF